MDIINLNPVVLVVGYTAVARPDLVFKFLKILSVGILF
jgi:hypothetical protein